MIYGERRQNPGTGGGGLRSGVLVGSGSRRPGQSGGGSRNGGMGGSGGRSSPVMGSGASCKPTFGSGSGRCRGLPLLAALALALLTACGPPRIDASTDEAMASSVAEVRESIPEAERDRFDIAVARVTMSHMDPNEFIRPGGPMDPRLREARIREAFQGKTAADVVRAGDSIRAAQVLP